MLTTRNSTARETYLVPNARSSCLGYLCIDRNRRRIKYLHLDGFRDVFSRRTVIEIGSASCCQSCVALGCFDHMWWCPGVIDSAGNTTALVV